MKKNRCSNCRQGIDRIDFYIERKSGKICSECYVYGTPLEPKKVLLFRPERAGDSISIRQEQAS